VHPSVFVAAEGDPTKLILMQACVLGSLAVCFLSLYGTTVLSMQYYLVTRALGSATSADPEEEERILDEVMRFMANTVRIRHTAVKCVVLSVPLFTCVLALFGVAKAGLGIVGYATVGALSRRYRSLARECTPLSRSYHHHHHHRHDPSTAITVLTALSSHSLGPSSLALIGNTSAHPHRLSRHERNGVLPVPSRHPGPAPSLQPWGRDNDSSLRPDSRVHCDFLQGPRPKQQHA
jgi:hypothetical protein